MSRDDGDEANPVAVLAAAGLIAGIVGLALAARTSSPSKGGAAKQAPERATQGVSVKITKTEAEWKKTLTPEQYRVLREEGTEMPFANRYWNHHGNGVYTCAGCGQELFSSATKFNSGSGWPSYTAPFSPANVREITDRSLGMTRVEVECSRCGGHLGHVFDDGPAPTGLRYCINSAALQFVDREKSETKAK